MFTNYLIYFHTLSEEEKLKQFFMILIFFLILFAICGILKFLKLKYLDDTKDSLFQRFLKKLWFYLCYKKHNSQLLIYRLNLLYVLYSDNYNKFSFFVNYCLMDYTINNNSYWLNDK